MLGNLFFSILKNKFFWYICSRYLSLGLLFVASIFTANKLGVYYFGIWSFILLLFNIGSTCNWGIGNAITILLVQNKENQDKSRNYLFNALVLNFLISLPPVLVAVYDRIFGISLFAKYDLGNAVYAVAVLIILSYFASFMMNVVRVKNRIWEITIAQTMWPVFMLLLLFFASGKTLLWSLLAAYLLSLAAGIVIYLCTGTISSAGKISLPVMKEVFYKGFCLFLYNAGFSFIVLSTKTVISKYYPVEEFSYFAFGFTLAHGVLLLIDSLIFLIFPKMIDILKGNNMNKAFNAISQMRETYLYAMHALLYVILAAAWMFFVFVPKYSNSFEPFILIVFTLIMYSNCFAYNTFLLAQNKEMKLVFMTSGALVLNITLALFLAYLNVRFDHIICATLMTYGTYSLMLNLYAQKLMQQRKRWQESISLRLLPLYLGSLLLVFLYPQRTVLWIPLVIFVGLNFKKLQTVTGSALKLLNNKKMNI